MRFIVYVLALCLYAFQAFAMECPQFFLNGKPPEIVDTRLQEQTYLLCNKGFAVMASGITKTPLWAAEVLTRNDMEMASAVDRKGKRFYTDKRLGRKERAVLSDYIYSGFDRGHLAPSADMTEDEDQQESFALSNIVPQTKDLNRHKWEKIEAAVRRAATHFGKVYVVTGVKYDNLATSERIGDSNVMVPDYMWKAVYDPFTGRSWGYVCSNTDDPVCHNVGVSEIARFAGVEIFPDMERH